jgi:hypothetical protein
LARLGALFFEPERSVAAGAPAGRHGDAGAGGDSALAGPRGGAGAGGHARGPVGPCGGAPTVVVLCSATRARAAAAGVALALAGACGSACATVAGIGVPGVPPDAAALPAARRAAARLRADRLAAGASGRLVWLDDPAGDAVQDGAGLAGAASSALGRAVAVVGTPAVLAVPFARTAALDRVLGWHAGIVVVREPAVDDALVDRSLASLAALGRPVVELTPPARWPAALSVAGLRAPGCAAQAVAQLGLAGVRLGG